MKTNIAIAAFTCLFLVSCGEKKPTDVKPDTEWTDVALAAAAGDIAAIEKHLAGGADINAKNLIGGNTLLNLTSLHGHREATEWLIEKGAKVDMPNTEGATALYIASSLCHSGVAALLLEKGANVNHKNNQGATPLDSVTWKWNQSLRDLYVGVGPLLRMEIDVDRIGRVRPEIADLLRKNGGKQNPDLDIWVAVKMGHLGIVEKYLAAGNDVNAREPMQTSLLMMAAGFGQTEVVELLIEKGADLDTQNATKDTPLSFAAFLCQPEVVALLLEKGATTSLRNGEGKTALDVVTQPWTDELAAGMGFVGLMLQHPVDVDRIKRDRPEIAKLLRDHGAPTAATRNSSAKQVLDRFVGEWKSVVTNKVDGTTSTSFQSRSWSRGGEGVVLHENGVDSPGGTESAVIWRYDSENGIYRFAMLISSGWNIIEGTWDEEFKTMKNKGQDAWGNRGSGYQRFIDKDNAEWAYVIKNSEGEVIVDLSAKQTRVKASDKEEKAAIPAPERSAEQEVLGRFVGEWKEVVTNKGGAPSTTMISRYWSRSGKGTVVHQENIDSSNGAEGGLVWRYDSENELYRNAFLLPNGWVISEGTWDEKSETMTWNHLADSSGSSGSGTHRFIDKDYSEWTFVVKSPAGEVVLDLSAKVSRVQAADKK